MRVDGKIGGGIGGMNLASVTVQVKKVGDSASKLVIDAAAKEGLINQGTASSAVSRLLEAMN
jgi:ribosomal protein S20